MFNFRSIFFWGADWLKGSPIKKHLNDIVLINDNFNNKASKNRRDNYITSIINHTKETVSYYQDYSSLNTLTDFPIVNKNIIRDNFNLFCSNKYLNKKKHIASTSGSTGAPFKVYQDKNKVYRNNADTLYMAQKAGYKVGDRLFYIKIWPKTDGLFSVTKWLKNIKPHSVYKLSDSDINALLKQIISFRGRSGLIGYSSSFRILCKYLDKNCSNPIPTNVKSIIAIAERLDSDTKQKLEYYFNCPAVSRYSNNENGMLAQQFKKDDKFYINLASYYIEVLNMTNDNPAPLGEPGRVVITDLFNYAMPIIRYDIGDVAVLNKDENGMPYIERIEGRILDTIYNTQGQVVSSHLAYHLCKYGDFKQFQLIQSGKKEYIIRLNTENAIKREEALLKEFKGYLGKDAQIKIEYVTEIPILSSGKRREVTNLYNKQNAKQDA